MIAIAAATPSVYGGDSGDGELGSRDQLLRVISDHVNHHHTCAVILSLSLCLIQAFEVRLTGELF